MDTPCIDVATLTAFTEELFRLAGCDGDKPAVIAAGLVEADLLGHTTHGLQLAAGYLNELNSGAMRATGEPQVMADRGAVATWNGRKLPGIWLTAKAVELACERAMIFGTASITIRQSHHIGCLAIFLERATSRGLMITIASSDPAAKSVAPFGGRTAVFTPNPFAIGIPTSGDPILIDTSASITTNGLANRLHREGALFPGEWALDAGGVPTDDPAALFTDPPGTLLPVGGIDHGHKGYGLALMIEALTQGLGGFGRADQPTGWGASVFVQAHDPEAFGGWSEFQKQMDHLVNACHASAPLNPMRPVRLPGERGLALKREALKNGVALHPGILESLEPWAKRLGVRLP